jgi:hypothetical protein
MASLYPKPTPGGAGSDANIWFDVDDCDPTMLNMPIDDDVDDVLGRRKISCTHWCIAVIGISVLSGFIISCIALLVLASIQLGTDYVVALALIIGSTAVWVAAFMVKYNQNKEQSTMECDGMYTLLIQFVFTVCAAIGLAGFFVIFLASAKHESDHVKLGSMVAFMFMIIYVGAVVIACPVMYCGYH